LGAVKVNINKYYIKSLLNLKKKNWRIKKNKGFINNNNNKML